MNREKRGRLNCEGLMRLVAFLATGLPLLLYDCQAWAHKVTVFAWVEAEAVHVEAKFAGGNRVIEGDVEVYEEGGTLLLRGKTDNQGKYTFTPPKRSALTVVVQAGMGHRGEWIVSADDFQAHTPEVHKKEIRAEAQPVSEAKEPTFPHFTSDDLQRVVEEVLDKRLGPMTALLVKLQDQGPTFRDILGGVGYILGLVGLSAYLRYRPKKRDTRPHD